MNKNKLIFLILGIIVVIIFISIFLLLSKTGETTRKKSDNTGGIKVWILQDDKSKFNSFIEDFKATQTQYKDTQFLVSSFANYEEYYHALIGAFLRGDAPDIFMVNNNDAGIFEKQISGLDPTLLSPDEFRKNYDVVFSNDLIRTVKQDEKDVEFLLGVPLGYENLGIYYNFRDVKGKKLTTWAYVNEIVRELRENSGKIGIGLGNGSTVYNASDIITQFLLLEGINKLADAGGNEMKSALSNYIRFGDINQDNKYDELFTQLTQEKKNNLDAFSSGDVQMILGTQRMLLDIEKKGFNKNFLRANVFPMYNENNGKLLINYNYFVINKNTLNYQTAQDLLVYFSKTEAQKKYLELFTYYLPTQLSLLPERLEENILNGYSIKHKDFYNSNLELTTFNKGNKSLYDNEIAHILDNGVNSIELFEIFRKKVLCMSSKTISGENLEVSCN